MILSSSVQRDSALQHLAGMNDTATDINVLCPIPVSGNTRHSKSCPGRFTNPTSLAHVYNQNSTRVSNPSFALGWRIRICQQLHPNTAVRSCLEDAPRCTESPLITSSAFPSLGAAPGSQGHSRSSRAGPGHQPGSQRSPSHVRVVCTAARRPAPGRPTGWRLDYEPLWSC